MSCAAFHSKKFTFPNVAFSSKIYWRVTFQNPTSRRGHSHFSPHHRVQPGSEAHPASYPTGTGCKAARA